MTAPQRRAHIAGRVQHLESWAFTAGGEIADIKAAIDQLPTVIRQEILEYTEPVFGEIMAGRATLATRQDLEALERRLTDRLDGLTDRLDGLTGRVDGLTGRMDGLTGRVDVLTDRLAGLEGTVERRLSGVESRLDRVLAALAKPES
ncbi:hypothetical protein [Nonomuraea sp. KM88]|uniref:hypothetical protein n=1 Tax=Nonomuraea sp. KM88 TaxID=3457427 RepID=UPI003FCD2CCB